MRLNLEKQESKKKKFKKPFDHKISETISLKNTWNVKSLEVRRLWIVPDYATNYEN